MDADRAGFGFVSWWVGGDVLPFPRLGGSRFIFAKTSKQPIRFPSFLPALASSASVPGACRLLLDRGGEVVGCFSSSSFEGSAALLLLDIHAIILRTHTHTHMHALLFHRQAACRPRHIEFLFSILSLVPLLVVSSILSPYYRSRFASWSSAFPVSRASRYLYHHHNHHNHTQKKTKNGSPTPPPHSCQLLVYPYYLYIYPSTPHATYFIRSISLISI